MRGWLRFLLPLALLVSMAGAPQSATAEDEAFPSDPAKHPKVVALLNELTEHVKAGDRAAASKLFDVNTMVADLEAMGFFRMPPGKSPTELRGQLRLAIAMGLRRRQAIPEYETQALRKVSRDTKDGRLIVYAVLDPGTLEAAPVRWYLVPDGDGWKIWDFESLDMGVRFIPTIGIALAEAMGGAPMEWAGLGAGFQRALVHISADEPHQALEVVLDLLEMGAPDLFQSIVEVMAATCYVILGDFGDALPHLDEAERMAPEMPVVHLTRALALNGLERHAEALTSARRYMTMLEPLAAARLQAGIALHGLGRKPEALVELRAAADEVPEDIEVLAFLGLCLPADASAEYKRRLAKLSNPVAQARELIWYLMVEDVPTRLKDLADALEAAVPGHHDVPYIRGEAASEEGDDAKAKAFFLEAQRLAYKHPEREELAQLHTYVEAVVDAFLGEDDAAGAYEAALDKSYALHAVAEYLVPMRADYEDKAESVTAFVAHVRKAPPSSKTEADTLLLEFLDAEVAFRGGAYAPVAKILPPLLARVDTALEKATASDDPASDVAWDHLDTMLYSVEDRLIRALVRTKQYDAARKRAEEIAERDVDSLYAVMVLAAEGKTEAVIQRIRTAMEQDEDAETFFDDADLGKVLATKPYAALKAELITDD